MKVSFTSPYAKKAPNFKSRSSYAHVVHPNELQSIEIPSGLVSYEQVLRYQALKNPQNRFKKALEEGEAHYFAKKGAQFEEINNYLEEIEAHSELNSIYQKIKDREFKLTYRTIQTTGQKEITFTQEIGNTTTKYVFIDGKLIEASKDYKKSDSEKVNFDSTKRITTLYTLGEITVRGEKSNYPKDIIQILNDESGQPNRIIKTTTNPYSNSVNTQIYYLSDYDENINVLSAIKKGAVKPRFQTTKEKYNSKDGSWVIEEKYNLNGIVTTRKVKNDNKGNWSLDFEIKDANGNILYTTSKSHKKISELSSTTKINEKTLTAEFEPDGHFIVNKNNYFTPYINGIEYDLMLDSHQGKSSHSSILYQYTKMELPVDLMILIKKYHTTLEFIKNPIEATSEGKFGYIKTPANMGIIAHEIGHIVDVTAPLNSKYTNPIHENPELIEIYKEELKNFEKENSRKVTDLTIGYFGKTGGNPRKEDNTNGGLSELVAETMSIISTPSLNHSAVAIRTHMLIAHFPKTIAYIANLIEQRIEPYFN